MRGQEQSVFGSSHRCLGFHDVLQRGNRDGHSFDAKQPSRGPDLLELEPGHVEGQVYLEALAEGMHQSASGYDLFRQESVERGAQRLVTGELEALGAASSPATEQVSRVRGQEEVAIESREYETGGPCIIVGASDPDDDKAHAAGPEALHQSGERVQSSPDPSSAGVVLPKGALATLHPGLVRATPVFRKRFAGPNEPAIAGAQGDRALFDRCG